MKIVIGVTTYGNQEREIGFLKSYHNNIENSEHQVQLVCVDDGTPNPARVRERETAVRRLHADFISNGANLGIPASWNKILNYAVEKKADLCLVFNDDIRMIARGWLTRMAYFFNRNENIGMVGFPLINERGFDDADPRWMGNPGLVGCSVGCAFAVRPEVALLVENPDGSRGFPEYYLSFHEELELGFNLHKLGYPSFMLAASPMYHAGGATFQANSELIWRKPLPDIPMEEFLNYSRACRWHIAQYEPTYAGGTVDRMGYSRFLFARKWGLLEQERYREIDGNMVDCYEEPQKPVHEMVVPKKLNRLIFFLDKLGQERSYEA